MIILYSVMLFFNTWCCFCLICANVCVKFFSIYKYGNNTYTVYTIAFTKCIFLYTGTESTPYLFEFQLYICFVYCLCMWNTNWKKHAQLIELLVWRNIIHLNSFRLTFSFKWITEYMCHFSWQLLILNNFLYWAHRWSHLTRTSCQHFKFELNIW